MSGQQAKIINSILEWPGPAIVGIDGPSASGKSTFADVLVAAADNAELIRTDDFYRPMLAKHRAQLTPEQGADQYFDIERLTEALVPLRAGHAAHFQIYDWSTDRLREWRTVPPAPLIVIEGVHAADTRCRPFLDLIVFVEAAADLRWKRMLGRSQNNPEQMRRWLAAEDWYFDRQRVRNAAQWIVSGGG